jgi:cell division septum initiation protein DivIVA
MYLETSEDVNGFLDALRQELEQAINNNERIHIR